MCGARERIYKPSIRRTRIRKNSFSLLQLVELCNADYKDRERAPPTNNQRLNNARRVSQRRQPCVELFDGGDHKHDAPGRPHALVLACLGGRGAFAWALSFNKGV